MLTVGFVVTPGFPVMSLAALSVFEFANTSTEKKLYDIRILSEDGMPVPSASETCLETSDFGNVPFDTVIVGGNTRVVPDVPQAPCVHGQGSEVVTSDFLHLHRRLRAGRRGPHRRATGHDPLAFPRTN